MPLDRFTPLRGAHYVAKRLGFSEQLLRAGLGHIASPRVMRRHFVGYEATAHDVFAATYHKSGTNWSMQIALQIAWRGRAEFEHILDEVAWPDTPDPRVGVDLHDPSPWERSPTGLRVIKTHLAPDYVPMAPHAKYLTVLRDPKEVLVSGYHFATTLFGVSDTVTPDAWLRLNLDYAKEHGDPWLAHALGWWALRDAPNVLVLHYAEMKRDLPGTVDQVAAFLGVTLTEAERVAVIERSGLAWMKAHQAQFASVKIPFAYATEHAAVVRRGAAGGASELYAAGDLARLDALLLAELEARGSDFPYRDLFDVAG